MKEIISAIILWIGLFIGTKALKEIHNTTRKAVIEKVSKGLPPLPRFKHSQK